MDSGFFGGLARGMPGRMKVVIGTCQRYRKY